MGGGVRSHIIHGYPNDQVKHGFRQGCKAHVFSSVSVTASGLYTHANSPDNTPITRQSTPWCSQMAATIPFEDDEQNIALLPTTRTNKRH